MAGVEIASSGPASSSTRITQRVTYRRSDRESVRSRTRGLSEAGEIAIRGSSWFCVYDDASAAGVLTSGVLTAGLLSAGVPSAGWGSASAPADLRALGSGGLRLARVGLVSIQSLSSSETRSIP